MKRINQPSYPVTTAARHGTLDKFLKLPVPTPILSANEIINRHFQEITDKEIAKRFNVDKAMEDALLLRGKHGK